MNNKNAIKNLKSFKKGETASSESKRRGWKDKQNLEYWINHYKHKTIKELSNIAIKKDEMTAQQARALQYVMAKEGRFSFRHDVEMEIGKPKEDINLTNKINIFGKLNWKDNNNEDKKE